VNVVRRSIALTLADNYAGLVLQLLGTMVIARLLTPEQIGVFAIAAVFAALATVVRDFGVAEYLIQERRLDREKIAATLTLNIAVSWMMAAAMFFGAPVVASFYHHAAIAEVMRVLAIGFVMMPFGAVTMAWFRRELDFRPVALANVAANLTSFVVSVGLAYVGFGPMALAWSVVAGAAVTVLMALLYRPSAVPLVPGLKHLGTVFRFSKFAGGVYVVGQVAKGLPEMIIGRAMGAAEVAIFSRGNGPAEMFHRLVMRSAFSVCMPYLAHTERAGGGLAPAYVRVASYVTAVGWPFLAFLGVAAFAAIEVVYGSQWRSAVPLARILCLACAVELIHALAREALLTRGLARDANSLQVLMAVLLALGLLLGVPFGLAGAAWGVLAATVANTIASQWLLRRRVGLKARHLLRACWGSFAITLVTVAPTAAWAALSGVDESNYLVFFFGGGALTVLMWLLAVRTLRHPLADEIWPALNRVQRWLPTKQM
jgi:O-antigen/teichoic acid export membrane protein